MDLWRDPVWNAVSAITALVALVLAVVKDGAQLKRLNQRVLVAAVNVVAGALVMTMGFILQPVVWTILQHGVRGVSHLLPIIKDNTGSLVLCGFVTGALTAAVAMSGSTRSQRVKWGALAGVVVLILFDLSLCTVNDYWDTFWFSMLCDVFGGMVAGMTIGFVVDVVASLFTASP